MATVIVYDGGAYTFDEETLESCNTLDSIDLVGGDLPIGVLEFNLLTEETLSFVRGKEVELYLNDALVDTFFLDEAENVSLYRWRVRCVNVVDKLQNTMFDGDIYSGQTNTWVTIPTTYVHQIIQKLQAVSGVPLHCDSDFSSRKIHGWIPHTTCRQALVQVAFAVCGIIKVRNGEIFITKLSSETLPHFNVNRCMQGVTVKKLPVVKTVNVTSRTYVAEYLSGERKVTPDKNGVGSLPVIETGKGYEIVHNINPRDNIILE